MTGPGSAAWMQHNLDCDIRNYFHWRNQIGGVPDMIPGNEGHLAHRAVGKGWTLRYDPVPYLRERFRAINHAEAARGRVLYLTRGER